MEVTGIRQPRGHLGTEKLQMLDLNKRLETYLGRVKFLEEENEFLKEEIQALQRSRDPQAWKRELEGELGKARGEVEAAWRERDRVELEVGNLSEELNVLGLQRQREAVTQAEAKKMLVESKKQLEEERRAQIWLREKTAQLEKELELHVEIHQEDVSVLQARLSAARPVFTAPPRTEVLSLQHLGQDYSQRAAQAWQEAAAAYQDQTRCLEDSLLQARAHMTQVTQEKREGCLMVQYMAKELDWAHNRNKVLEQNVSQQKNREHKEIEQLQAHLESLEGEKVELGEQISDILEDRRKLLQLKMSLGLEVATYRALLDSESLRVNKPSSNDTWGSRTVDGGSNPRGIMQKLRTTLNDSHVTSPVSMKLGKRIQATAAVMAMTPLPTPQDAPEHKPKSAGFTEDGQTGWSLESSRSAVWSTEVLNGKGSIEHLRDKKIQEEVSRAAALSAPRSQELGAIASLMDECNIDQPAVGDSDVSMDETGENEEGSHITEPEKYTGLNITQPLAEQESADSHSIVFSADVPSEFHAEIEEHTSLEVTLDLSEEANPEEPHGCSEDCEDVGMEISSGKVPESLHTPLFAWGEKEVVTKRERTEWPVDKDSEYESGSDAKEIDCAFEFGKEAGDYGNPSGFKQDEQVVAKFESTRPLKATALSKEDLTHDDEEKGGKGNENVSKMEDKDHGDDLSDGFKPEEPQEDELAPEEDRINAWDGENECEAKADSSNESRELDHDSEREMSEGISEVMDCSAMEQNEIDLQTEKEAISADEYPILDSHIDGNQRDVQQEQTSSDTERLDLSEEDREESLTASHSWRTDGGELEDNDSYTLENTLADTRPLIRYQSDEADMNTQASHLGDSDSSEDEGNYNRVTGAGFWGEDKRRVITSKSVEFMEDLDEEPERDTVKEEAAGEPYQGEEMDASPTKERRIVTTDEDDERSFGGSG
ncbi:hypothetical protein AAFF_G00426670 [Aldrovandia affinis]|uniref:IF rod domain-containing protein n=1 Tax=Aldrovandia affinis TaxID=143900 RepID=A0AAD7WIQ1_9TELE|nr:hypothetical protein AAFF_G00426670 [Aldrovandia affinis]